MSTATACARFNAVGRVQGVGFRASTVARARQLKLTGWVRNRADGSVDLVACGEPAALAQLERWLWQGPPGAEVKTLTREAVAGEGYAEFSIRDTT